MTGARALPIILSYIVEIQNPLSLMTTMTEQYVACKSYRVSQKTWTFIGNAITPLFMDETFQNFLCL